VLVFIIGCSQRLDVSRVRNQARRATIFGINPQEGRSVGSKITTTQEVATMRDVAFDLARAVLRGPELSQV
jgi:hypothetical protein